eukprot:SAG11_NODE_141_length_14934_cov_4.821503_13_plen_71_part_00
MRALARRTTPPMPPPASQPLHSPGMRLFESGICYCCTRPTAQPGRPSKALKICALLFAALSVPRLRQLAR